MQRRWVRRLSPKVLVVALCSVAMVVTAIAVSQADPRSDRAVSVAMLSGGNAAPLPAADMTMAAPEVGSLPESPPPTEPPTTTTRAADTAARPATVAAKPQPKPCPTNGAPDRACGPPCPQPGSANSATACPPPCAQPAAPPAGATPVASDGAVVEPATCPPPPSPPPPPPPPPPPCPSAAPTDQSCTPPCSYEPAPSGPAAGAFAPCASGVTGHVTAGPTCPVERPDEPCADKPVETPLRLLRKEGSVAATEKSYSDGSFRMIVEPGSYRLVADWPSRIGGCSPVEVSVEYGRFTYTEVSCDTGIR